MTLPHSLVCSERSGGSQCRENRARATSNFKDTAGLRQISFIEEIGAQVRCPRGLLKITMMPVYFFQFKIKPCLRLQVRSVFCYFIVSNLNTGYSDAIFSNSEIGASLSLVYADALPGAICKYAFKIGALLLDLHLFKSTCSFAPYRSTAFPSRGFYIAHPVCFFPSMDTKYLSSFIIAITKGKLIYFPDCLPTTSKVTE